MLIIATKSEGQEVNKQSTRYAINNVVINGFLGGVGALINKRDGENGFRVFLKGIGQGCLGGAFQTLGNEMVYKINSQQNLTYAWPARITSSIGNSISQNAASNINFWERWHLNLGFFRFDYKVKEKSFQARLSPTALVGTGIAASQGKFSLSKTLQTGILIFESKDLVWSLGGRSIGVAAYSSIAFDKNVTGQEFYSLIAHEVVHVMQYENIVWINPMFNKLDNRMKQDNERYNNLSKYIYFDLNGLAFTSTYLTQVNKPWECRSIERAADFYGRRVLWPRCN